jgi:hypothetical protein
MDVQLLWMVRGFIPGDGNMRSSRTSATDYATRPAFDTTAV